MWYGFVFPGGTAREQVDLAAAAEAAGWDAIFVWEANYGVDAWALLAAIAERTTRIRLGTMLTPLPWRRPWKLASQVATLDGLSNGRVTLSVGLGAVDAALGTVSEEEDRKVRAEKLDESIDLMSALWSGEWRYEGKHYRIDFEARADGLRETLPIVQTPRPPIWVVGAWPRPKSMRRVLRCDGLIPNSYDKDGKFRQTTPDDIKAMLRWLADNGGVRPGFDVVMEGETPGDDHGKAAEIVKPWEEAGCTWWLDSRWMLDGTPEENRRAVRARVEAGPPKL